MISTKMSRTLFKADFAALQRPISANYPLSLPLGDRERNRDKIVKNYICAIDKNVPPRDYKEPHKRATVTELAQTVIGFAPFLSRLETRKSLFRAP